MIVGEREEDGVSDSDRDSDKMRVCVLGSVIVFDSEGDSEYVRVRELVVVADAVRSRVRDVVKVGSLEDDAVSDVDLVLELEGVSVGVGVGVSVAVLVGDCDSDSET